MVDSLSRKKDADWLHQVKTKSETSRVDTYRTLFHSGRHDTCLSEGIQTLNYPPGDS